MMKAKTILIFLLIFLFSGFKNLRAENISQNNENELIYGKWVRLTQSGPVGMEFLENETVNVDFGIDGTVDVVSEYTKQNDSIFFNDEKGEMCPEAGVYKL